MTINEDVPGIEVKVQVNGIDAIEYAAPDANDQDTKTPTATKYVESFDNAAFSIRIKVGDDYEWGHKNHILLFRVKVDGQWINATVVRESEAFGAARIDGCDKVDSTGQWVHRTLRFAPVTTVDEAKKERVKRDKKIASKLGLIEITVSREIENGPGTGSSTPPEQRSFELAEKSLKGKAISHGTTFAPPHRIKAPHFLSTHPVPEDDGPIAIFRFLYRSREALKSEFIIPRTPEPPSPELSALREADIHRLAQERLDQMKGSIKREGYHAIKRESGEAFDLTQDDDDDDDAPLRPIQRPRHSARVVSEVVDLTGD